MSYYELLTRPGYGKKPNALFLLMMKFCAVLNSCIPCGEPTHVSYTKDEKYKNNFGRLYQKLLSSTANVFAEQITGFLCVP